MKRKSQEQFLKDINEQNPEIVVVGNYINNHTKIECKCRKCGFEWRATPNNLLSGSKCPMCSKHRQYTKKEFEDWLHENAETIELKGEFVNISTKALFSCKVCGYEWRIRPIDIRRGSRCSNCRHKYPTEIKDVEEVLLKRRIVITKGFTNISSKATLQCTVCGHEWEARVLDVMKRTGCPKCSKRYSPTAKEFREWMNKERPEIRLLSDYVKSSILKLFARQNTKIICL